MKTLAYTALLVAISLNACAAPQDNLSKIKLPPGFKLAIFAEGIPQPRSMSLGEDGTVYVGTWGDKVFALRDTDQDGKADAKILLAQGLNLANGVAYHNGDLYIAEIHRISKLNKIGQHLNNPPQLEVIYNSYPKDTHHGAKYLRVGPDGKLYVPVGAPCNICLKDAEGYANITRLDSDGKNFEIYARGIRNSVGFDWQPKTGELYFSDNGRDLLGDDLPPEELNAAPKAGLHFGYPYCHAGEIADPEFGQQKACAEFTPPVWKFPAHVAPLGIHFYRGEQFPPEYQGQLFVAQHGSWNRSTPQGYQVALVKFEQGKPTSSEIFAQGWLETNGEVWGRPVDVIEWKDGSLLVSDDKAGMIYRITYPKN